MKTVFLFFGCAVAAFIAMGYQLGVFDPVDEEAEAAVKKAKQPAPVLSRFPEDLLPAARWQPAPQAAEFAPGPRPHPLAFFRIDGKLHDWQELLKPGWQAHSVEKTELVVVVGKDRETFLSIQHYPNGAPPVSRFKYELEIAVVAAKSGKLLARQSFTSLPREIRQVESWELTKLGQPVSFGTVFNWVAAKAQAGFR